MTQLCTHFSFQGTNGTSILGIPDKTVFLVSISQFREEQVLKNGKFKRNLDEKVIYV